MTTLKPCPQVELLAAHCHEQWSGWMKYLFGKMEGHTIPGWAWERWQRQAFSTYAELPEDEKESDRKEARRTLEVMHRTDPAADALREAKDALTEIRDHCDPAGLNGSAEIARAALAKIEELGEGR